MHYSQKNDEYCVSYNYDLHSFLLKGKINTILNVNKTLKIKTYEIKATEEE